MCAGVWYHAAGGCFGHKVQRMQRPVGDTEFRAYSTLARVHRWATLTTIIITIT